MTTVNENELLTQTGPGNPGGDLMRRYWQPVALSRDIKEGVPVPVTVMGEKLVLFRDDQGRMGLLGIHCPHRRADLSYGRVEDGGLRCLYHGWLMDVDGRCLDQPAEPIGSQLKNKVRHKSYPCAEAGGAVFAYLGPGELPLMPGFHFLSAPDAHVAQSKVFQRCNYLQANEGNIDPCHLSFLHWFAQPLEDRAGAYRAAQSALINDTRPKIEIERTRFGLRIFTTREAAEGRSYLRVTNFVMPNLAFFSGADGRYGEGGYTCHWHVPIDDETHWRYEFYYHPLKEIDKEALVGRVHKELDENLAPVRGAHNRYLQDREEMKKNSFAGMGKLFLPHDVFATESPGPIHDRSQELLGTTDIAIAAARRMLLDAMKGLREGKEPPVARRSTNENWFSDILVLSTMIEAGSDPRDHCAAVIEQGDYHGFRGG